MTRPKRDQKPGSKARSERTTTQTSRAAGRRSGSRSGSPGPGDARTSPAGAAAQRPRRNNPRSAPELQAPPPDAVFRDRDGNKLTFPESALRRVAARLLSEQRKAWRYRPFPFPLFTEKGNEHEFFFDFYVYDNQDTLVRLILVMARESRETWDRVGRFKRQYPMYPYELWTPERLAELQQPRARLDF